VIYYVRALYLNGGNAMSANYMTRESHARLNAEAKRLREVEIPKVSKEKLEAAQQGDLRENAGYEAARDRLMLLSARLDGITTQLSDARFIEELQVPGDIVSIATKVRLLDLDAGEEVEYRILGPADADLSRGIISFESPLARGMIAQRVAQEFAVETPGGIRRFRILSIERCRTGA
jgi:transcription elongation factor GreA